MGTMNDTPSTSIQCGTCVAAGTTACTDCIVTHLLANDDGPVDFVPVALGSPSDTGAAPVDDAPVDSRGHPAAQGHRGGRADPGDRVIELFRRAGLVDEPVVLVPAEEFEHGYGRAAIPAH